jgi:hypothetical protein
MTGREREASCRGLSVRAASKRLNVQGLATVDVKDSAGNPGVHSDASAGVLDGQ